MYRSARRRDTVVRKRKRIPLEIRSHNIQITGVTDEGSARVVYTAPFESTLVKIDLKGWAYFVNLVWTNETISWALVRVPASDDPLVAAATLLTPDVMYKDPRQLICGDLFTISVNLPIRRRMDNINMRFHAGDRLVVIAKNTSSVEAVTLQLGILYWLSRA